MSCTIWFFHLWNAVFKKMLFLWKQVLLTSTPSFLHYKNILRCVSLRPYIIVSHLKNPKYKNTQMSLNTYSISKMHASENVPMWDSIIWLTCKKVNWFFQCMSDGIVLFYALLVLRLNYSFHLYRWQCV